MNIVYLKSIKIGYQAGYITKKLESKLTAKDEYDQTHIRPSITLSYPIEVDGYRYENYLQDVEQFYSKANHNYSEELAQVFTLFYLSIYNVTNNAGVALDKLNKCFTKANLLMVSPMRVSYSEKKLLQLEHFAFGKFQVQDVKEIIKKHIPTTDFWDRYIKHNELNELVIQDYLAIQRDKEEVKVFNLFELYKYLSQELIDFSFDVYFETLSELKWKQFWDEFNLSLADAVAFGMAFYDKRLFYDLGLGDATQFTMFTHIAGNEKQGWMIPLKSVPQNIHYTWRKDVDYVNKALQTYHEMKQLGDSEFLRLFNVLKSFASTATIHLQDDRPSDAFINLTAGLDAVLNSDSEEARSNTLKNRMAILSFSQLGVEFRKHYFAIKDLYDLRSQFVHAGMAINRDKVYELFDVVDQVMEALLQMHQLHLEGEDFTLANWYTDMDDLIKDAHMRVHLDSDRLEEIGALVMNKL